jgi:hypothetical protein
MTTNEIVDVLMKKYVSTNDPPPEEIQEVLRGTLNDVNVRGTLMLAAIVQPEASFALGVMIGYYSCLYKDSPEKTVNDLLYGRDDGQKT